MSDNVLSSFTPTRREERAYGRTFRVGIIGTGWIAEAHAESYLNQPDVKIVALADLIPGKAEAFFRRYGVEGVRCYPSHKELLDDASLKLDAVSVCTYNATHAECTIYALEHGVSVLLEKPMCVTLDEAVAICKAEKASKGVLSIGFQPRFDENMKMLKRVVQSGELGQIYYIQTGGGRRRQRGSQPAHRAAQSGDAEQGGGPGSGASHRHSAQKVSVPGKEARAHG